MLDICLIGTGGMMPLDKRWLASMLIRYNGKMMLIDCGEGTQIPLRMSEWGFKAIDTIVFTHYHADHITGLPGLLLTIGNSGREEPLTLMGPPGIKEVVEGLTVVSPELPYELRIVELSDNMETENKIGDIVLRSIPVDHTITCLAYCIEIKRPGKFNVENAKKLDIPVSYWGKLQKGESIDIEGRVIHPYMVLGDQRKGIKVCYCTDTRPTNGIYKFAEEADVLVCEGMYGDDENQHKAEKKKHMTFREAATIAKHSNVKELYLTHYSPSLTDPEEYIHVAREVFENAFLGTDLLAKTIRFEE